MLVTWLVLGRRGFISFVVSDVYAASKKKYDGYDMALDLADDADVSRM